MFSGQTSAFVFSEIEERLFLLVFSCHATLPAIVNAHEDWPDFEHLILPESIVPGNSLYCRLSSENPSPAIYYS